ncbi:uncharacterized protein [Diadema antillarum]|uniref:uncharacterized protein n=1 Tax=Diadema antillarum TaxID=105358 RepID=UPI003A862D43
MATSSDSTSKRVKKQQTFREDYHRKWQFIIPSKRSNNYARCTLCSSDFSIGHGGANDIQAHIKSMKHRSAAEASESNRGGNIAKYLVPKDNAVIRAEVLMTQFLIEHNVPFAASDHLSSSMKEMFPDSKVAAEFACRRTKTTAIARTLGQEARGDILCKIRERPFSISTDGSSDRGAEQQLYPIIVRYFDCDTRHVVSVLLEIATTTEQSTRRNIFQLLDHVLKENNIPWSNVICFSADNAAVIMGVHNGVAAFVRKENSQVFVHSCPCHLLHLAAEKGAQELPCSPADLLIPVFYFLEKSSKRHKEFKAVQACCGAEQHSILKHVCTRWLSLERAVDRLLEQWEPLVEYFQKESKVPSGGRKRKDDDQEQTEEKKMKTAPTGEVQPKKKSVQASKSISQASCQSSSTLAQKTVPASTVSCPAKGAVASGLSASRGSTVLGANVIPARRHSPSSSSKKTATTSSVSTSRVTSVQSCSSGASRPSSKTETAPSKKKGKICAGTKNSPKCQSSTSTSPSVTSAEAKAAAIHANLTQDKYKLYCLFLQNTIPIFNKLNVELQEEAPKIHVLLDRLHFFLRQLLMRFVKPAVLMKTALPQECDYKCKENQRADDDLILGSKVRDILSTGQITDEQRSEFFSSVRNYFVAVSNYVVSKFPLKDELLMHARVANPTKRCDMSFFSVKYFVQRFHFMEDALDQLELEFASYQSDCMVDSLPEERVDLTWSTLSQMQDKSSGELKYGNLAKVMHLILSIAHSNASDERLFSMVRKNMTEFRPSLGTQTLSDLLTQKMASQAKGEACFQAKFSDKVLEKCKGATMSFVKHT